MKKVLEIAPNATITSTLLDILRAFEKPTTRPTTRFTLKGKADGSVVVEQHYGWYGSDNIFPE